MKTLRKKIILNSTNFSLVALVYFSLHRNRVKTSVKSLSSTLLIRPRSLFLSFLLKPTVLVIQDVTLSVTTAFVGIFFVVKKKIPEKSPWCRVYTWWTLSDQVINKLWSQHRAVVCLHPLSFAILLSHEVTRSTFCSSQDRVVWRRVAVLQRDTPEVAVCVCVQCVCVRQ